MKIFLSNCNNACSKFCLVKSVRIWSYSGPYFPAFGLNTERYSISLRIQSECEKIRTRITPNTDTFRAAFVLQKFTSYLPFQKKYFLYAVS